MSLKPSVASSHANSDRSAGRSGDRSAQIPRLVTSLAVMEGKAILAFTEQMTKLHASRIVSIGLYGTGRATADGKEDIEVIVLTKREDPELEDELLDILADIVVDTGVYLTVKCFSQPQFKAFSRAGLAMFQRIRDQQIPLY